MPININLDPPPSRRALVVDDNRVDFVWHKWFKRVTDIVTSSSGTFFNYVLLEDGSDDYSVLSSDSLIFADPASGDININLTPGADGKVYSIKNLAATGANQVNVFPLGYDVGPPITSTEEIEGTTSLVLNKGEAATLMFVATKNGWFII